MLTFPRDLSVALVLGLLAGCSAEQPPPPGSTAASEMTCLPGLQVRCPCSAGTEGVQVCLSDGLSFSECTCPDGMTPVQTPADPAQSDDGGAAGDGSNDPDGAGAQLPVGDGDGAAGPAAGGAGAGGGDTVGSDVEPEQPSDTAGGDTAEPPLTANLRIQELALYQTVKIPLMRDGEAVVERNAPVVVGKEALLRVFVSPEDGWQSRDVTVRLQVQSASDSMESFEVTLSNVSGASNDAELGSSANFEIPGELITAGARFRVSMLEADGMARAAPHPEARWPADGELAQLSPRNAGPVHVMIVPYRYLADGSGRLPDTSQEQLDGFRDYLQAFYPAREIEISLHDPVDYSQPIGSQAGWPEWLEAHCARRTEENTDPKLLWYGMARPAESFREYGGGVAGISFLPGPAANYGRCSVGLGFGGASGIMAHELGHALGLPHAPCGVEGGPFPYTEAKIGSWGYGHVTGTLKDPDEHYDLMSYCNPTFISDYNYQKLFERIRYLNLQFSRAAFEPTTYQRLLIDEQGNASWRGEVTLQDPPAGEDALADIELYRAGDSRAAEVQAYWLPFSEAGGLWLLPRPEASIEAVRPFNLDAPVRLP